MQHEQETTRVAELRRDAPGAAARVFVGRLKREMSTEREAGAVDEVGDEEKLIKGLGAMERRDEVERTWRKGVEGLDALQGITGTVAKLERASKAVEVVEGM